MFVWSCFVRFIRFGGAETQATTQQTVAEATSDEAIEEKLTRAVDRPVITTVVEIPSDLAQRETRLMIDAFAYNNTRQIKAWRQAADNETYTPNGSRSNNNPEKAKGVDDERQAAPTGLGAEQVPGAHR